MNSSLPPGTLEMIVLRILARGPLYGYAISQQIAEASGDVFRVPSGSLYPALRRLISKKAVKVQWSMTDSKRFARYYTVTPAGRERLRAEMAQYGRAAHAISRILGTGEN